MNAEFTTLRQQMKVAKPPQYPLQAMPELEQLEQYRPARFYLMNRVRSSPFRYMFTLPMCLFPSIISRTYITLDSLTHSLSLGF